MSVAFTKMHGLGNDFVVIDRRRDTSASPLDVDAVRHLADRRLGVGCDQVILLEPSREADVAMRIFNPDGSEAGACGNATRCIAALLAPELGRDRMAIDTAGGRLAAAMLADGRVRVDMGVPRFGWRDVPLAEARDTAAVDPGPEWADLGPGSALSMGNPHCVFFAPDLAAIDLPAIGPRLEHHPLFPERANIGFAQILGRDRLRLRVWERGAGLTLACGSGACAAGVAAMRRGLTDRTVDIDLDGGSLTIAWRADDHVDMTGPAAHSFSGTVPLEGIRP